MSPYASSLVVVPLLVLLAGCAGQGADSGAPGVAVGPGLVGNAPTPVDPAALDGWADFPVDRKPRPILLIGQVVRESGYHTGDAKIAVATSRFQLDAVLPAGPPTIQTTLPDGGVAGGAYELPAVTAEQAYEQVRALGKPENAPGETPTPLRITKVTLGTAPFLTDRGTLTLPAWLFEAPDSFEPLAVPALAASAFWKYGTIDYPTLPGEGELSADGLTLTVPMEAPNPGACPGDPHLRYVAEIVESPTAVAIGLRSEVISIEPGERRDDCGYDAMLRTASYTVKLAAPLGNRVLVGMNGAPVPIS